jgi:NTP pyrophosphatase (non-canonical NTP hydrolase)
MNSNLDLSAITEFQRKFAEERNWNQFHTPKNLAAALSVEAAELMEIFQWLTPEESAEVKNDPANKTKAAAELADILYYTIRIADIMDVQLDEVFWEKMRENAAKYPVELAKGNAKKYNELQAQQ